MTELYWTGERVVPGDMQAEMGALSEHLQRYTFAISTLNGRESVIDAACGTGYGSFMLAMSCERVTGFDISPEAVAFAQERFRWPGLSYDVADLDEIDLPDGADVVVSFETIEHLKNPERFVSNVARCLKPGGKLIASIPRDMPNDFHLHVYDFAAVRELMEPHFERIDWVGQSALELGDARLAGLSLSDVDVESARYFLGICYKASID